MNKVYTFLLFPAIAFAQPTAIHYSANGDYLVDQDGNKTTIVGHPHMICYVGDEELHGKYEKVRIVHPGVVLYLTGWSLTQYKETGTKEIHRFAIPNPVCDLK